MFTWYFSTMELIQRTTAAARATRGAKGAKTSPTAPMKSCDAISNESYVIPNKRTMFVL